MIELKEGMSVFTRSGEEVGKVNRFIVDPATNEVTHIVIQKGWLLPEDKVVSFQVIDSGGEDKIVLNEDIGNFDELPPFEETYFVRADDDPNDPRSTGARVYPYAPAYYWYPARPGLLDPAMGPGFYPIPITGGETRRNIPEDTVALKEGTDVLSSEGEHVGDVERLIVDPDSNQTTHFVITQGLLFKDRKLVPVHWVQSVAEDQLRLAVSTRVLERLPSWAA
jgi:uncharacterized protein YrrD